MNRNATLPHTPSYRRLRRKIGHDLAFVDIDGHRNYLGPYDTPQSRERYHRLIAELEASGGVVLSRPDETTVAEG